MKEWEIGKVAELITKGTTPTSIGENFCNQGIPFLRAQNIKNGLVEVNDDILFISEKTHNKDLKRSKVLNGDILLTIAGSIGRVGIVKGFNCELNCNQAVAIIRIKNPEISLEYVCRFLGSASATEQINRTKVTATIANLSLSQIAKIKIPLPPLAEQKRIAAILDAADLHRQKTHQLITKYNDLSQSLFLDMFGDPVTNPKGWEISSLDKCYVNKKDGTKCGPFGSALKKNEYVEQGVPVWTMYNIKPQGFDMNKCLFIEKSKFDDLKSYETLKGDIIISRAGTVGKMCVVDYEGNAIISTNLIRLRLNIQKLNTIYFTMLMSNWGTKIARLKTGADGSFTHMNTGILNSIRLQLPPISTQNKFAAQIQEIEKQKAQTEASLQRAEDLFQSLLQKAFKGEL